MADTSFEQLLRVEEDKLLYLGRRLFAIEAFYEELNRVTREKPFMIWNNVVWTMVLDCRDGFVIHFVSWIRGMREKGGFLRQIQAHRLRELPRRWKAGSEPRPEQWLARQLSRDHGDSFARIFPEVTTAFPKPADIEALRVKFIDSFLPIVSDRDSNRAHPYEKEHARNAKMLDLKEMRALMSQAEAFLNNLRLVGCASSFGYGDMNSASVKTVAKDLVNTILIGPEPRWSSVLNGRSPEQFYEDCHRKYDQIPAQNELTFNGPGIGRTDPPG